MLFQYAIDALYATALAAIAVHAQHAISKHIILFAPKCLARRSTFFYATAFKEN